MYHRFQCLCGTLKGKIEQPQQAMRAVCYCTDCQTYAHLLGQPQRTLDALGGTDVIATQSRHVRFTSPTQTLACLSLSPKGLLRWYASCCNTPIANTPRDWKLPYAGLVHTCLNRLEPMGKSFPAVQMYVNPKTARGPLPGRNTLGGMASFARVIARVGAARLTGGYKHTPFFDAQGSPIAAVKVAAPADVEKARRSLPLRS